jgi:hypothetical protein
LSVNELRWKLAYHKARICQAESRKCGKILFCKNAKKSLSQGRLSCYSFPVTSHQPLATMKKEVQVLIDEMMRQDKKCGEFCFRTADLLDFGNLEYYLNEYVEGRMSLDDALECSQDDV